MWEGASHGQCICSRTRLFIHFPTRSLSYAINSDFHFRWFVRPDKLVNVKVTAGPCGSKEACSQGLTPGHSLNWGRHHPAAPQGAMAWGCHDSARGL